jgi:hypothetical protein
VVVGLILDEHGSSLTGPGQVEGRPVSSKWKLRKSK